MTAILRIHYDHVSIFLVAPVALWNSLPPRYQTPGSGRYFCERSQVNVHRMILYDNDNNDNKFDGLSKYDYCCANTDPDFGSYQSLMSIVTYSL